MSPLSPVSSIKNASLDLWRILFLIEGIPSLVLAICVFLFLPNRPQTSKYLTENERTLCHTRLNADNNDEGHTGIDWNGVKRAFVDWKTYVVAVMCEYEWGVGSITRGGRRLRSISCTETDSAMNLGRWCSNQVMRNRADGRV
jgi:hypothetical protein